MKYYFMETVKIDGREKLRPLPGQTAADGTPITPELNVQGDMTIRRAYEIGTVFCSDTLALNMRSRNESSTSKPYYQAGRLFPILDDPSAYLAPDHEPTPEMRQQWDSYRMSNRAAQQKTIPTGSKMAEQISKFEIPTIDKNGFHVAHKQWRLIVRNILRKENTILTGPTGTGKTELVMLACRQAGIDCHVFDMGSMHDPISGLLGTHRIHQGGSVFDYSRFTEVVQKPGIVLLDELNRAPVTALNILFPCLDSRRQLPVEIAGGADMRSIDLHPDCVFFATANLGHEYTGTSTLDRALSGRFMQIELNYMPTAEETMVLSHKYGISKSDAASIVQVAATIRNIYSKEQISCSISTRETQRAASLVQDGWSVSEAMEASFLPLFEGNCEDGERSIVKKIIMTT
jgi:MoxR-like ATPase